jgi:crossover junction endodeoxyribonuclease RuvC
MVYIGIDPGKHGAIAFIYESGSIFLEPYNRENYIKAMSLASQEDAIVMLERVWALPHEGVSSSFSFGENFGFIQGILEANRIEYTLVTPPRWTKFFELGSDKKEHIRLVKKLYPQVDLRRNKRCRNDFDGYADAILLAEYGRRLKPEPNNYEYANPPKKHRKKAVKKR